MVLVPPGDGNGEAKRAAELGRPQRPMRGVSDADGAGWLHASAAGGDAAATEALVERYTGLAKSIARRVAGNTDHVDDAVQVAMYALLRAIERFDLGRGVAFSTFAHATIDGELKRHRRKTAWAVHVPRRLQELYLEVSTALDDLGHRFGRRPTVQELAAAVGAPEDDIIQVLEFGHLQRPSSLDAPRRHQEGGGDGRQVPYVDAGFAQVERSDLTQRLLSRLDAREREIVELRFFDNLTQSEIAKRIGLSQMHVSRLLRAALERLRALAES
jgi:RNA polymerase sigma-B factor